MTTTPTPPRLGRCKDCDYALFVADDSQVVEAENFREVKGDGRAYRVGNNGVFARCPNRHKFFMLKQIKGTYSPDHKCDARCLNAKGHDCTCSCGGANHGRGHAVNVVEASVTSIDTTPMATEKQENFIRLLLADRVIPAIEGTSEFPPVEHVTGDERRANAIAKLNAHEFTKKQASATIEWLLTLVKEGS